MKKCPYCGRENDEESLQCKECGTRIRGEISKPQIICPACGETEKFERLIDAPGLKWSVFILGGWLSVVFLTCSRPKRFRCKNCEAAFSHRSVGAKVMLGLLVIWLSFCWLPLLIRLFYFFFSPP
jgi:Double zinc ribbon